MCVTQDLLVKCDQLRAEMSQLLLSFLQHPKRRQRDVPKRDKEMVQWVKCLLCTLYKK